MEELFDVTVMEAVMIYYEELESPIGVLAIEADEESLLSVLFKSANRKQTPNSITKQCKKQLKEYFAGKREEFDLPLKMEGTPFQQKVWGALLKVPYGKTSTYGNQAKMIKNPKAIRAVGSANGKNKISIIVPCHRIIGADGTLTGYAGGLNVKKWLLEHESKYSRS